MLLKRKSEGDNVPLKQITSRISLHRYPYLGSFPSDYVPIPPNETFGNINRQPNTLMGEHWITIGNLRQKLFFAVSMGREMYCFFKQQYKQLIALPLQSHQSVFGYYTINAAFNILNFRQEKNWSSRY